MKAQLNLFELMYTRLGLILVISMLLSSANNAQAQGSSGPVIWDTGTLREVYNPSGDRYSYAPSIIVDGNTEHIWSCHNRDSGVIKDYIYYTKRVNGVVQSSQPILSASASGWDSVHTCDPSVVRSNVTYNSVQYQWVMFYLGTDIECSCHNAIGVAVAQDIAGPWVKYPVPLFTAPEYSTNTSYWGVGQASATSIDGQGRFLLFYTQIDVPGSNRGMRREINISNLNNPILGAAGRVPTDGLIDLNGNAQNAILSYDIAYNGSRDRFYAVLETYPFSSSYPDYLSTSQIVASIDGGSIWNGSGTWQIEGRITPSLTGLPRNHNAGLKRDLYGGLADPNSVGVVFTDSCGNGSNIPCNGGLAEWSYDLWEVTGQLTANYINNTSSSISYTGAFTNFANRGLGDYGDDVHATLNNNDAIQYTFAGSSVGYITEKNSDQGDVDIYIDGVFQQTVSTYNTIRLVQQVAWRTSSLGTGTHTIRVVKRSGAWMLLDGFVVP